MTSHTTTRAQLTVPEEFLWSGKITFGFNFFCLYSLMRFKTIATLTVCLCVCCRWTIEKEARLCSSVWYQMQHYGLPAEYPVLESLVKYMYMYTEIEYICGSGMRLYRLISSTFFMQIITSSLQKRGTFSTLLQYIRHLIWFIIEECKRSHADDIKISCAADVATVSWPTDLLLPGNIDRVPDSFTRKLLAKLKNK